jgi:hypothetical protein
MALLTSIRNRAILIGLVALLLALWVLKTALGMAGAAIRFVVIIGVALLAIGWITSKVGRGRRR